MASVDAGSIYSDVRVRLDKLTADISSVNTSLDSLNSNITSNNKKSEASFESMGAVAVAQLAAITLAFKSAVSTFAETEQSLANVKAVSNATAAEFDILKEAASEAGTTTRFTAGEAADALYYLASAGLDATQSVEALDGVLQLAGASGSDLATAAQAVTSTLSQYGLEASQASDVSNVFAAATANSQATLEKLQSSLSNVGSVAGSLGIGLEETVASLEALYNNGYKAETAGTALKTSLAFLATESSTTVTALKSLGVAFEDINPDEVGLTGAIEALGEAGLSTADILDAFGTEAGPAMVTLLNEGADGLKDYEDAITDTDEAARQYADQNDTLAGSFDSLKSASEGAGNELVETLEPIMRTIADAAASLLRYIAGLPDIIQALGAGAGVAAGGFVALSQGLSLVGVSLSTGPLGLVALAGAAAVALVTLSKKMEDAKDRTDELAEVTASLTTTTSEYKDVTAKLNDEAETLSASEKAILEARKELLALQMEEKLAEYAAEYAKYNEQVEREAAALDELKSKQDDNLAYNDKLEDQEGRLAELKETIIGLEEKVASGSATAAETIKLNALNQAYQAAIENEEGRIETKERYQQAIAGEIAETERSLASAKAAFAETQLAGEESINAFARAYNEGNISIETYKLTNEELYDTIIARAAELAAAEKQAILDAEEKRKSKGGV